jgi:hypothetical protein
MKTSYRMAFLLYLLVALAAAGGGLAYLLVPTIMPYHQQIIGVPWDELGEGLQALLWIFVKMLGGFMIIASVIIFFLTLVPFRHHERWVMLTLPLVALLVTAPALGATIYLNALTGAATPIVPSTILVSMVVVAFLLSLPGQKSG